MSGKNIINSTADKSLPFISALLFKVDILGMSISINSEKIKEIFQGRMEEIIERGSLEKKLKSGKRLTIKLGADPTAPDLHLGHSVCLKKLREFQDLGHKIVFIVGDFTVKIGDPSGRTKARPFLSEEEIKRNTETYFSQVEKILDIKSVEIRRNSEWFSKINLAEFLALASNFTVARILERDDFKKRMELKQEIGFHEIIYPILQAYDSFVLGADVEIGGSDQRFNLLCARDFQQKMGQAPQDVVILPLLLGLDGKQKMSKSFGNYIGIAEKPEEQYGKIMSIPDSLILHYFELGTNLSLDELQKIKKEFGSPKTNPKDFKARLAREIVKIYHGEEKADSAEKEFIRVFQKGETPQNVEGAKIAEKSLNILDLLVKLKLSASKAEARRLVEQGGVKIQIGNQKIKINDWAREVKIEKGMIIQTGKRHFVKIN